MTGGSDREALDPRGRCAHCGDVIGVYAPAVWATDDGRVVTASPLPSILAICDRRSRPTCTWTAGTA